MREEDSRDDKADNNTQQLMRFMVSPSIKSQLEARFSVYDTCKTLLSRHSRGNKKKRLTEHSNNSSQRSTLGLTKIQEPARYNGAVWTKSTVGSNTENKNTVASIKDNMTTCGLHFFFLPNFFLSGTRA